MAAFVPGGGDDELTVPPDTFAEADPVASWPEGLSIMAVSDTAAWNSYAEPAQVLTHRTGGFGMQWLRHDDASNLLTRTWDIDGAEWTAWSTLAFLGDITDEITNHVAAADPHAQYLKEADVPPYLPSLPEDSWGESEGIGNYYPGTQTFGVSAGANWGPNTGQAGLVVAVVGEDGAGGVQHFTQYSNNIGYRRTYTGGSWTAWADVKGAS